MNVFVKVNTCQCKYFFTNFNVYETTLELEQMMTPHALNICLSPMSVVPAF